MKKLIITLGLVSFGSLIMAQTNDPSYSIHNYKHPNKAKEAMKAMEESNTVSYINEQDVQDRNYKNSVCIANQSGALVATDAIEVNINSVYATSNYKNQFSRRNQAKNIDQSSEQNSPVVCNKPNKRHNEFVKKSQNYKSQF
jgi:hypothetical protein